MTELIGNWLMNSVGCNIRFSPETLGKACFDGKLFAQILVTYNVCSSEYLKLIKETVSPDVALSNLKQLCVWFKLLGISITDQFLKEIVNKSGSACLRLLYELYIRLENQECIYFMDSKKKNRILSQPTDKFQVIPVPDELPKLDLVDEKQYLRDILNTMKGVMQSAEKDTVKRFLLSGMKNRAELMKKEILKSENFCSYKKQSCPDLDIQAKINEFEELLSSPERIDNMSQQYKCSPENYVSYLKLKRRKMEADKKLKLKMEKNAMQDAWRKILSDQETEIKNILSTKLLKQSEYEKQMTLRLKRLRLKYKKFIDNKNMMMDIAEKQETVDQFKSTFHSIKGKEMAFVEKERIKELHLRLYKENMRLKRLCNSEACRRIVEDIVDYAMLQHEYFEKNGINMPRKIIIETKYLFIKGIRLLSPKITQNKSLDEIPIIKVDVERIQELADLEYHLYMYRVGPWLLSKNPDPEELNIIGYIVHRLLDRKYNYSLSVGTPADLPSYEYKIFLQRINDTLALEKLKHYLAKFQIDVIDVFTVINYFLNAYKTYMGIEDIKQTSRVATPLKSKTAINNKKARLKSKASGKRTKEKLAVDKWVQFPSREEIGRDINYSESAKLGKYVYEILQSGGLLPDALVCYLIIEYLKTLKNINGWVLLNYPENITQVAILEYMFTGLEVPFMPKVTDNIRRLISEQLYSVMQNGNKKNVDSENNLLGHEDVEYDEEINGNYSIEELVKLRNSNILPKPNISAIPPVFQSFFTRVVILQRETETKKVFKKTLAPLLSQPLEEEEEKEITLETFYFALGDSSYFNYKSFDFTTLKRLLRFILCVSSSQQHEFFKNFDKGIKNVSLKLSSVANGKDILKPLEFVKTGIDKWVKNVFEENGEENLEEAIEEEDLEEDILIYPGHKDWEYTELPIPEIYANILATVWESIEYFFINNLKECFGLLRTVENRLMPYRNYVRRKAEECLTLDDDRSQAVTNFQLMLNGIDDHHRSLNTMKNELHFRTLKLQCDLWRMTDVKKFYCEQVMELIKYQNWISVHLVNLLRVYSFVLQIEVDRFTDTMQLLEDYYSICLLGYPQEDRMTKLVLPKIGLKTDSKEDHVKFLNQPTTPTSIISRKNHSTMFIKHIKRDTKSLKSQEDQKGGWEQNIDSKTALYYADFEMEEKPIFAMLRVITTRLKKNILQIKNGCQSRCNAITDKFKEHARAIKELETKGYNIQKQKVTKHPSQMSQKRHESEALIGPLKIAIGKVFLEWSVAIDNETNRVLYRTDLIEQRANADASEDIAIIDETFRVFKEEIASLYHCQILNTDKVCDLIRAAIEEETKIQPLIVMQNDKLEVDPSVILYPDAPPPPPPSLKEMSTEFQFTISQLTNLFYKLVYVAPFGIIEQTFVQILEDMVCMGHEMGHCYLPHLWSSLSSSQIKDIVYRLFGDKTIIDWRLFIIFGLDLSFPTLESILEMKKNFAVLDTNFTETVTYEQYSCVFLWFENAETWSIEQDLYYAKAKELLFKIFQISDNVMNYTDFLLAFCRDIDPREGFVKALALAEGCATVAWKQDLFRETFQIEKENEKYDVAYGILTIVLAGVFQVVDSVIITELLEEDNKILNQSSSNISLSIFEKKNTSKTKIKRISKKHRTSNEKPINLQETIMKSDPMDGGIGCDWPYKVPTEEKETLNKLKLIEMQRPDVIWKSDVYFSTVFSLLMVDIHHFALSSDQIYEPIDLEDNLRRIFIDKGTGHSMKLHTLLSETYIQNLFSSYRCFQAISLSQLLTKLLYES